MLMDLHFHTDSFSPCSRLSLEDGARRARERGLDGICLTEHDRFAAYGNLAETARRFGLLILVGVEIYAREGDILCFGLPRLPEGRVGARELTDALWAAGGATVAAHPYRDNNRGVGDLLYELPRLSAVEAFNGNTDESGNARALRAAREAGLKATGSSDAHSVDRVGVFATRFAARIATVGDLAAALRSGDYEPAAWSASAGRYVPV